MLGFSSWRPQVLPKYMLRAPEPEERANKTHLRHVASSSLESFEKDESFRFLDLPVELRMEIYTYFVNFPRVNENQTCGDGHAGTVTSTKVDDKAGDTGDACRSQKEACKKERREISVTRRSLLQLCHQVSAEFLPIFYQTSKVIVHRHRVRRNVFSTLWPAHTPSLAGTEYWFSPPKDTPVRRIVTSSDAAYFMKTYLGEVKPSTTSLIRHLDYDASIWDRFVWLPHEFWGMCYRKQADPSELTTNIDFPGLRKFSQVLARFKKSLPCLETVRLHGVGDEHNENYALALQDTVNPTHVWAIASELGQWDAVEKALVGQPTPQSGALYGWSILREVVWEKSFISHVGVTFQKPSAHKATGTTRTDLDDTAELSMTIEVPT